MSHELKDRFLPLHLRFPVEYGALKAQGHSPAKAVEILLDATRGDRLARARIDGICRLEKVIPSQKWSQL